jgi:hypothetical protein
MQLAEKRGIKPGFGITLFHHSRQRIFEMPSLRGEAFELRYENEMKKGSAFILSPE